MRHLWYRCGALNVALAGTQPLRLSEDNTRVDLTHALRHVAVHGVVQVVMFLRARSHIYCTHEPTRR